MTIIISYIYLYKCVSDVLLFLKMWSLNRFKKVWEKMAEDFKKIAIKPKLEMTN